MVTWIWINIGSGNDLLFVQIKPLREPVSTNHGRWPEQFLNKKYNLYTLHFIATFPRGHWAKYSLLGRPSYMILRAFFNITKCHQFDFEAVSSMVQPHPYYIIFKCYGNSMISFSDCPLKLCSIHKETVWYKLSKSFKVWNRILLLSNFF